MSSRVLLRESDIKRTARVAQIEGMFDVPHAAKSSVSWTVDLTLPDDWSVGVIVGPSGCGKTTIARELFGLTDEPMSWDKEKSVVDAFPVGMSIKEIAAAMSAVGFSSPPSWLRPFHALSNGEQFRVTLARLLAESPEIAVCDEFTSVVDRQVAQIASAACAKAVRRSGKKFIAVSCHYDILDWLEPDWVYEPHTAHFYTGRGLHQRPSISLEIVRCDSKAWDIFRKHHYLSASLHQAAACFVALVNGSPAAFASVLSFPHATSPGWREHRTVCLPDFQGVGIGNALSEAVASAYSATGRPYRSTTSAPAMIQHRSKSKNWVMTQAPNVRVTPHAGAALKGKNARASNSVGRGVASFQYVGKPNPEFARMWGIKITDG